VTESSISDIVRANGRFASLLKGDRLVAHNLIVGAGTIAAGVLGVAFQSLASHQLHPADYGAVFAVVTLITFIGLPASAFTLLMARETSRGLASGQQAASATLLGRGNRALLLIGMAIAGTVVVGTPALSTFFNVPYELLWAAALGIPFGLALPLLLGELQGQQRFIAYTVLTIGQAAIKLIMAVGLGLVLGPLGIVGGITVATVVVYVVALRLLRRKLSIRPNLSWWRPAVGYLAVILPSTAAVGVLLSSDVLLVKHFFPTQAAGQYAAVAALGRAIFWGASAVAIVLFPKITFRRSQGKSGTSLVSASLILVGIGGLAGYLLLSVASKWLLSAFAGTGYAGASGYLAWYSIGMLLLGAAAVLIATQQSRGRPDFLAVLLPLSTMEPFLILVFHQTLTQVVQIVDISMLILLSGLVGLYLLQERRSPDRDAFAPGLGTALPQLQGN